MEAIFPVCGAGGPQLKRNPLGGMMASRSRSPVSAHSLLAGSRELAAALSTLALHGNGVPIRGAALIAAHSVELVLKSYLLAQGWPQKKVEKLGHNLTKAWGAAADAGLGIDPEPPPWAQLLQSMHDDPYFLRYPPVNSGLVSPNAKELQTRVDSLIELVAAAHHAA